ncbi:hypothetical protein ACFLS1_11475 [Verrucomicrobiota bacterium]
MRYFLILMFMLATKGHCSDILVKKTDINEPLTEKNLYFALETRVVHWTKEGHCAIAVNLHSQIGEKIKTKEEVEVENKCALQGNNYLSNPRKRIKHVLAEWVIYDKDKKIKTKFRIDLDYMRGRYYSEAIIKELEDVKNSKLILYYEDVDNDKKRENYTFVFKIKDHMKLSSDKREDS